MKKFIPLFFLLTFNIYGQTVLDGMWVYADDFNNRSDIISNIRILVFNGNSFLDTTALIGGKYIALNKNTPDSGTFRVDVPNKRVILTDPFGASTSLQYVINTVSATKYLQLKTANGSILTYYAYTPVAIFNSERELMMVLFKEAADDLNRVNRGAGTRTTRDPEFQRQWEEANKDIHNPVLPPNLVLPGGETVEERARSGQVSGK